MKNYNALVEKHRELILAAERYIWQNPETGYKEYKTDAYMKKVFSELGYKLTPAEGITGFITVLDTGREGPEVLILGELDSIICPEHPESDPETGAVHSCGHNAQCAALIGVAAALKEDGVLDGGFGEKISRFYSSSDIKVLNFGASKEFTDDEPISSIYERNNLSPAQIIQIITKTLNFD